MKLICEVIEDVKYFAEEVEGGKKKNYYIEGIFMQGDIKNRNGRRYPSEILEREVKRYNADFISKKRAFGELGHPSGPTVNLERVSHIITDLKQEGSNFSGRAKIMIDNPYGKIVKGFMDEGAQLGVSSRGMGTLKEGKDGAAEVQKDFYLATAGDIVADPSAPDAFVDGIMEGKEWIWDNGIMREATVADIHNKIKNAPSNQLESVILDAFGKYMAKL